MQQFKTIVLTLAAVLFLVIIIQNTEVMEFRLLFFPITMSRALFFALVFLLGAAAGWTGCLVWKRRRGRIGNAPTDF